MNQALLEYYFSQEGLFMIPVEQLSSQGMSELIQQALLDRNLFSQIEINLFNAAFSLYWKRAGRLHKKAPRFWYPPRILHVCIVTDAEYTRPYYQPFHRNSWLLYAEDFDPASSTLEFSTYQFFHVERMVMLQQIVPALYNNISYFLSLSQRELEKFVEGCQRTRRPDQKGYRALAEAIPWLQKLHHEIFNRPRLALPMARVLEDTGLILTQDLEAPLGALQQAWSNAAHEVFNRHQAAYAKPAPGGAQQIGDWLIKNKPLLLVTGSQGEILWDPETPERIESLLPALEDVTERAVKSILQDLEIVGLHTQRFLQSLKQPDDLVDPASFITEDGLSYIHKDRKLVGYNISKEENAERLWQTTPPYERLMLAARTVHEWGHLCAESNWVRIPEERQQEREDLLQDYVDFFDGIYQNLPAASQQRHAVEYIQLTHTGLSLGQAILKAVKIRIEDYMANCLAQRFLNDDEMDTYVRNNVCSRLHEYTAEESFMQIARLAYEFQYLKLSRIENPVDWFMKCTWFKEQFIRTKIITQTQFDQLLDLSAKICDCYELDESAFDFSGLPVR